MLWHLVKISKTYGSVFVALKKGYDSLDRPMAYKLLKGYGVDKKFEFS